MVDGEQPPGGPVDKERLHRLHGRGAGQAASLASTKRARLPRVSKISAEMSSSSTAMSNCSSRAVTTVTTAMESNSGMLPNSGVEGSNRSTRSPSCKVSCNTSFKPSITAIYPPNDDRKGVVVERGFQYV